MTGKLAEELADEFRPGMMDEARANLELYRMEQLSRGMVQQVYNNNTWRLPCWVWLTTLVLSMRKDVTTMNPWCWEYEPNILRAHLSFRYQAPGGLDMGHVMRVNLNTGEILE